MWLQGGGHLHQFPKSSSGHWNGSSGCLLSTSREQDLGLDTRWTSSPLFLEPSLSPKLAPNFPSGVEVRMETLTSHYPPCLSRLVLLGGCPASGKGDLSRSMGEPWGPLLSSELSPRHQNPRFSSAFSLFTLMDQNLDDFIRKEGLKDTYTFLGGYGGGGVDIYPRCLCSSSSAKQGH